MLAQLVENLAALGIGSLRTEVGWREHELLGFMERNGFAPVPRLVLELDVKRAATSLDREESEAART